jgi:hypothetical protein
MTVPVKARPPTLRDIRRWPPTCDPTEAALALGVSRSSFYEAIRCGTSPVKTIRVGRRIKVLTADLLRLLECETAGLS